MRLDHYTGAPQTESGVDPYLYSRSIRGVPTDRNRTHKARQSSWDVHYGRTSDGHTVSKRIGNHTVGGTVTVYKADGTITEHDPSEFRRARQTSRRAQATQITAQARRIALLESVGNSAELASGDV